MGARDILNSSASTDADTLRDERNNRVNQPDYAPGQDDEFFDDGLFGDSPTDSSVTQPSTMDMSGGLGGFGDSGGLGGTFNSGGFGMTPNQPMQPPAQNQPAQNGQIEDKIFDAMAKGAKGSMNFIKDLSQSVKLVTPKFWSVWGSNTFIVSIVVAAVGLILWLFKVRPLCTNFMVGGFLSAGVGAFVLMLNVEKGKNCTSKYKDGSGASPSPAPATDLNAGSSAPDFGGGDESGFNEFGDYGSDNDGFGSDGGDDFGDFNDGDFGGDDFDDDFGSDDFDDNDDFDDFSDADEVLSAEPVAGVSTEEALATMVIPDKGMYTRQYLYDMFTKVLDNIKPDFATIKSIDEDSDVFLLWEKFLRDACEATGIKEENLPNLNKLEENLFIIKLTFDRPTGLKHEAVAVEIANIFAYASGEYNSSVYAKSDVIGKSCVVTVFTGETAMISLKDMYGECESFILDNKNYMPVVLGINPLGKVIKFDFKKLESILITGMPRSGKSWFVQAVLTQMCAFVPPSELNVYICDPKEGISDFKAFQLPHVKKFVSGDMNIVNTLRSVVRDLAPKRKKIIADANCVNIWDYKEVNPDVHMPVIYILIDEVVTLAERMEKEVKQEFQGLLVELISQLPALGIRAFLIPHVVKNDIIAKTATDLIPCRISVCGDAGHIESSTGTKPRDFPYKLTNKGDMAVRLPAVSPETLFIHGPALSDSNPKNNNLFAYLLKMWRKLEPEEFENSVAKGYEIAEANEQAVKNLNLDDTDDIDVFSDEPDIPVAIKRQGVSSQEILKPTANKLAQHQQMPEAQPDYQSMPSQGLGAGAGAGTGVSEDMYTPDDDFDPLADDTGDGDDDDFFAF